MSHQEANTLPEILVYLIIGGSVSHKESQRIAIVSEGTRPKELQYMSSELTGFITETCRLKVTQNEVNE